MYLLTPARKESWREIDTWDIKPWFLSFQCISNRIVRNLTALTNLTKYNSWIYISFISSVSASSFLLYQSVSASAPKKKKPLHTKNFFSTMPLSLSIKNIHLIQSVSQVSKTSSSAHTINTSIDLLRWTLNALWFKNGKCHNSESNRKIKNMLIYQDMFGRQRIVKKTKTTMMH